MSIGVKKKKKGKGKRGKRQTKHIRLKKETVR
jgi:hypothetical protein